ncbi:MAG TPA: serine hydrolase [Egibacteraceae bacterium]|nr:serine hydrolase [Egibacteraceae bacterium]
MTPRRRRRVFAVVGGALFGLLLLAVVGAVLYLRPIAPIATGYAAKLVCSTHFVTGSPVPDAVDDLPDNPLVPALQMRLDDDAVRVSLLGLWPSTAYFTPGRGCTLSRQGRPDRQPLTPPAGVGRWPRAGVESDAIDAAIDRAFTDDPAEGVTRRTRALLVVHDGRLIAERYADGFSADTPMLGWSMTKSIAGALTGIMVDRGDIDLEQSGVVPGPEDGREDITVEHLLHMTPGLAFEEVYEPPSDVTHMLFASDDVAARAADEPLEHAPGAAWHYSSGTTNLLCAALQEAAGGGPETAALARDLLFAPLGMHSALLETDAAGNLVCSSFAYARARDWARLGQLYLDDGRWGGQRVLPEGWVELTTTPVAGASPGYGAQWWLNTDAEGNVRLPQMPGDAFWAAGNSGQNVVVLPSHDTVIVRLGLDAGYESSVDWGLEPFVRDVVAALE